MSQPATCPNCGSAEFKSKTSKISPETGARLSMLASYGGMVLLFIGVLLIIVGLINLSKADNAATQLTMTLIMSLLFLAPGLYLVYPWLKGGQEPLIECKCKQCKHRWCWSEKLEIHLLKAWLPGSLGTLSETWMELGPNWFALRNFDKHFDIRKDKAARQVEFLTTTYSATGPYEKLNGQPMINVGRREGAINGIVLEADGYEKLKAWVPPATAKDVKTMSLRNELQNWGKGFILVGGIQGFIAVNLSGDASSSASAFGAFWAFGLIIVGLLGMLFINPVLLLVDALVIAVAGLLNVTSGTSPWTIFGLFQFAWAAGLCWRFFHYLGAKQAEPRTAPVIASPAAPPPVSLAPANTPLMDDLPMPTLDDIMQPAGVSDSSNSTE